VIEVSKKENETSQALLRRFKKQLQKSGLLLQVRRKMFRARQKSKLKIREAAKKRHETKTKMDYLRKLGKLKPEE
jgi:ribosomal protein S21